jgi:hypothetical protein
MFQQLIYLYGLAPCTGGLAFGYVSCTIKLSSIRIRIELIPFGVGHRFYEYDGAPI